MAPRPAFPDGFRATVGRIPVCPHFVDRICQQILSGQLSHCMRAVP